MADPEYFLTSELRALPSMSDAVLYTEPRVLAAAAHITGILERRIGTSFVARTVTDERHDGGCTAIELKKPFVLSVTSATENGTAVTGTLRVDYGILRRYSSATSFTPLRWAQGRDNVTVTYQAGYSDLAGMPPDIKEAVLKGTRAYLLETNSNAVIDDRRASMNTDKGTIQYTMSVEDQPTGYPQVDAVINGWRERLGVFGYET